MDMHATEFVEWRCWDFCEEDMNEHANAEERVRDWEHVESEIAKAHFGEGWE
jgi:hypothetical protein